MPYRRRLLALRSSIATRASKLASRLHERLVTGYLPRYAPFAANLPWLFNLRDRLR